MVDGLHLRRDRVGRRDFNAAAQEFKQRQRFISTQRALDADVSVKALSVGKESTKKSSGGVGENEPRLKYEASAKRAPGQWFKHWATAKELTASGDEPNFGWMDPVSPPSKGQIEQAKQNAINYLRRRPKISVTRYDVDPRTGQPNYESFETFGVKALGRTLRNMMPGANAGAQAAQAAGLIVDDLGKFRCPPGTPAANQFTDAFGSNCFKPTNLIRSMMAEVGSILRGRFNYVDPSLLGIDPDKAPMIRQRLNNIAGTPDDLKRSMDAVSDALDALRSRLGTTGDRTLNQDLFEALDALTTSGEWELDWKPILADVWGDQYSWDDSLSVRENLEKHQDVLRESMLDFFGSDDASRDAFGQMYASGDTYAVQEVENLVQRHQAAMRGILSSLLHEYNDHPDALKRMGSIRAVCPDPATGKWDEMGFTDVGPDGKPYVNYNLANFTFSHISPAGPNGPEFLAQDGKWTFVSADGPQTEAEHLESVRQFLQEAARHEGFARQYIDIYGADMAEALYASVGARAQQVGYHELAHVGQYTRAQDVIEEQMSTSGFVRLANGTVLDKPISDWTADEYSSALFDTLLYPVLNGNEGRIPPVGVTGLEGDMLHLLAGRYYQDYVDGWLNARRSGKDSEAAKTQGVIVMEAMAELHALQRMGILKGKEIDDATAWMWETDNVIPSQPLSPGPPPTPTPTPSGPGAPGGPNPPTVDPPDVDADAGASNVPFVPHKVENLVDTETGEIMPAKSPWEFTRDFLNLKRSKGHRTAEAQRERSVINNLFGFDDVSYDYLEAEELNTRYERLRDIANELRSSIGTKGGLTTEDAARLFFAVRGMEQIMNQNDRRRRMGPDAAIKARREGKKTSWGLYVKPNLTDEGEDISDLVRLTDKLLNLLPGGDRRDWISAETIRKTSDKIEQTLILSLNDSIFEPRRPYRGSVALDTDLIRRGTMLKSTKDFDDAVISAVARKTNQPDPTVKVTTPSEDLKTFVFPILKAMDEMPLDRDTEARFTMPGVEGLSIGDSIDHDSMIKARITTGDGEGIAQGLPEMDSPTVRVVLPKGSRGLVNDDDNTGRGDSVVIPPGSLRVIQIDDDGTIVMTPVKQKSLNDVAKDIDKMAKGFSSTRDGGVIRERRKIRNAAREAMGQSSSPRRGFASRTSTRSEDISTAIHAEHRRRVSFERAEKDYGFTPFDIKQEQIDALAEIVRAQRAEGTSASTEMNTLYGATVFGWSPKTRAVREREIIDTRNSTLDTLRDLVISQGQIKGTPINPEVAQLLSGSTNEQLEEILDAAIKNFVNGFDKRVRVAVSPERLDKVLETGRYLTTHETKSDHSGPSIRRDVEFTWGYPTDAPPDIRPSSGFLTHSAFEERRAKIFNYLQESGQVSRPLPFKKTDPELMSTKFLSPEGSANKVYGSATIVLKQDVSRRSAWVQGDSARSDRLPHSFASDNPLDMFMASISTKNSEADDRSAFIHDLLVSHLTGEYDLLLTPGLRQAMRNGNPDAAITSDLARNGNDYFEAVVHAGFELDDIEHVRIEASDLKLQPVDRAEIGANDESVTQALRDAGLSDDEIDKFFNLLSSGDASAGAVISTMPFLRLAIAAQEQRDKWQARGIDAVFPNQWGVDLLDPDTYLTLNHSYDIAPGDAVSVLKQFVSAQIKGRIDRVVELVKPKPPVSLARDGLSRS